MEQRAIIEGNKLIALFMGYKEDEIQAEDWCGCNVLDEVFAGHKEMMPANYHENWSRLMPVVEKIESLGFCNCIRSAQDDNTLHASWFEKVFGKNITEVQWIESKINAVYISVLQFITWYNQQIQ